MPSLHGWRSSDSSQSHTHEIQTRLQTRRPLRVNADGVQRPLQGRERGDGHHHRN